MQQHELALQDYLLGLKYKEIADKYGVSENTVKSWKKRHGWSRDKTPKKGAPFAPLKNEKCCTPKKVRKPDPETPEENQDELSDQEQLFVYYFLKNRNATQAALSAGYGRNGNKQTATVLGCRLLQRPRVRAEIDKLRELVLQEIKIEIIDLLQYCVKVVFSDLGDMVTFGQKEVPVMGALGPAIDPKTRKPIKQVINFVDLNGSDQIDTSVIQEIKQGKDGVSIKLADKKWAWEQLIKYFDWLPDTWQRQVEEKKLDIAKDKLAIEKAKNGDDDDGGEEDNSFIEALGGKVSEVWNDAKE